MPNWIHAEHADAFWGRLPPTASLRRAGTRLVFFRVNSMISLVPHGVDCMKPLSGMTSRQSVRYDKQWNVAKTRFEKSSPNVAAPLTRISPLRTKMTGLSKKIVFFFAHTGRGETSKRIL